MQKLAARSNEIRYLFKGVDVSRRYLWVELLEVKTSQACKDAPKQIIAKNAKPSLKCNAPTGNDLGRQEVRVCRKLCHILSVKRFRHLFHQKRNRAFTGGKKHSISQISDHQKHARE